MIPGDGGPNGLGYWVQNGADEIEITPDGTVIAGTGWDEAGRCVGLYKEGRPNRVLLKQEGKKETAWGWNTGNDALAVDGTNIFVANSGKRLLRFTWAPGNLDSAKVAEEFGMPGKAVGLAAARGRLAVAYTNRIELRSAIDFAVITNLAVSGMKDATGKIIRRHVFRGWDAAGKPQFETEKPKSWPWPEDFQNIRRVIYDEKNDSLYLSGYLKDETIDSWGVTGKTLRRYDGWLKGDKTARWTIQLPMNPDGEGKGKPLSPESLATAGDYLFVGMCKPDYGKQHVHILALGDGAYVGSFVPGSEVGGNAGWPDMPYAVAALKRKNGEYLVLVEEDWRGKNLLYRWTPEKK